MNETQKRMLSELSVIRCSIGNRTCNASDFQWIWLPGFYNCYRFNSGFDSNNTPVDLIRVDTTESVFKFTLEVYTGLPDYWFYAGLVGAQSLRGLYVFIQNSTDFPFNLTPSPTLLTASYGAEISVDRSFYSQFNEWPYEYSECRVDENNELMGAPLDDAYLFDLVVQTNYTYTRTTCIFFCAQVLTTQICQCNHYDLALRVPNFDLCVSANQSNCANNFFFKTFQSGDFIRENCLSKCPLECHKNTISASFNYYRFPNANDLSPISNNKKMVSKYANETISFGQFLPINVVKFSVFYGSSMYSVSEEKAKITLDDLIGSIGGHLHLFLGMSLISFFELIELIYIVIITKESARKEKLQPNQKTNLVEKITPDKLPIEIEDAKTIEEDLNQSTSIVHQLNLSPANKIE